MRRGSDDSAVLFSVGLTLCVTALFVGPLNTSDPIPPGAAAVISQKQFPDPLEAQETYFVGIAQIDVTPEYPVRLGGFGFRSTESEGVTFPIAAKALAISRRIDDEPVVLITVDSIGIPAWLTDKIARRLNAKAGLSQSHLSITATHTHTSPLLRGLMATIFGEPIPVEHQVHIDRYTDELTDNLEKVAIAALEDRRESHLSYAIGSVGFAMNRRTKTGPVDHDLPLLAVKSLDGTLRAVYVSYACHCVTLSNNRISGDWAGYAQDLIQRDFPSAIAMISIGCGADQNPSSGVSGEKTDIAIKQGNEIAAEVKHLLGGFLSPIHGPITANRTLLTFDFEEPPTQTQWEEKAKKPGAVGYHARVQLERLARGEGLQTTLDYPITTWCFDRSLAMVFLPGEPVVDYSLRIKKELDGQRLWINGYSNDVPCYIPSERILSEGGYEGGESMAYFDRPGRLKTGLEARIVSALHQQLDSDFLPPFDPDKTRGTLPKSPWQTLETLHTTSNLRVDLVVSEPLISDPVAIDFGLDGSLWVAEMRDYPSGIPKPGKQSPPAAAQTDFEPGGRIRLVRDRDGDGQFDSSTVFLDSISFPTGVMVWRHGVLICAAPDILYAEDTDGDDKADEVRKVYTGFGTTNIQARVNSLCNGLDGWIYGSCGLFGGTITSFNGQTFELGDRDFRIKPETGEIEAATGRTQQGRVRDDYGNWFGCDNTNLAFHYPLAEHYLNRNPFVASPPSRVSLAQTDESRRLFPARIDAQRFQLSGPPGTVTAACGIGVYRDTELGLEYAQNLFVCEPVNLLVHRIVPKSVGTSFTAERSANEQRTEFLRSTDTWFRPVQAVTGPDGALWIVDMYRFVIEDPRWIPESELAPLDVRAGSSMGRIYRVRNPTTRTPPAVRSTYTSLARQSPVLRELQLQWLASINNADGDHHERTATRPVAGRASDPVARIDDLRELSIGGWLTDDDVSKALTDADPHVQSFGLLLAERRLSGDTLPSGVAEMCVDSDLHLRLQAACSLGQWSSPEVGPLLANMALNDASDPYMVAAVFSSLTPHNLEAFTTVLFQKLQGRDPPIALMTPFLATAAGYNNDAAIRLALTALAVKEGEQYKAWQLAAVTNLIEALSKRPKSHPVDALVQSAIHQIQQVAREMLVDESLDEDRRLAAINLLGRESSSRDEDTRLIVQLLTSAHSPTIQIAAVETLGRIGTDDLAAILMGHFRELSPQVQPRVIDTLLSRENWMDDLFKGIKRGTVPSSILTAEQRQELLGHPNPSIRERANALFSISINSNRQQVVQQYQSAFELNGDFDRGRIVYTKICAGCHRIGDLGYSVGPNLAILAKKTPAFILQEMLDPNRNVDARYISYVAITKSGLSRTGLISSESSTSVTLVTSEEKKFTLLRNEIDELRSTGKSLMPEGLEKDLSPQDVADVVTFLTSVLAMSKRIEGNQPLIVRPVSDRLILMASTASIVGDQITFEPAFGNVGYWHAIQDHVFWTVEIPEKSVFDVYMEFACDPDSAGNGFVLETGEEALSGHVESTGGWDRYSMARLGRFTLSSGPHRIVMRPDGANLHGALVDLRAILLIPAGESFALALHIAGTDPPQPVDVARRLLNDKLTEEESESIVLQYSHIAAELVAAMTADLTDDLKEEYRRIPKIWHVAVACGKRNRIDQMRSLLNVSMPRGNQPLKDWQAVVVGGGVINGIGLVGGWPKSRMNEVIGEETDLKERWLSTLDKAAKMVDDEKINSGTRYDAMRIIALDERPERRALLTQYLHKGTNDELQMGAISGLSDIDEDDVPLLLIENVGHFNAENQGLAINGLLRFDPRTEKLLDAISSGRFSRTLLNTSQRKALLESKTSSIRQRAIELLAQ